MSERIDNAPDMTVGRLWTVDDVAAYLRVTPDYVYREARVGRIPKIPRRVGNRVLFDPQKIVAWATGESAFRE